MLTSALTKLLATSPAVKIATANRRGEPWLATAYFAEDGPFTLHMMLEASGHTLANLQANPRVAVMLENGDALALFGQADGTARVVEGQELPYRDAIAAKTPASAPLVSLPNLIPVQIDVHRWRLTHVAEGWMPAKELARPTEPPGDTLTPNSPATPIRMGRGA